MTPNILTITQVVVTNNWPFCLKSNGSRTRDHLCVLDKSYYSPPPVRILTHRSTTSSTMSCFARARSMALNPMFKSGRNPTTFLKRDRGSEGPIYSLHFAIFWPRDFSRSRGMPDRLYRIGTCMNGTETFKCEWRKLKHIIKYFAERYGTIRVWLL
jgi:hypothetical protein